MAHTAKDGARFTNRPMMTNHNRSLERMNKSLSGGEAGSKGTLNPLKQPEFKEPGEEEKNGHEVAAEHGPAHEIHIEHNHEAGEHHVHSVHPDGHEHHSDHASAEEAHDHAAQLAGVGAEEPDGDEMAEMGNADENESFGG